jgi:hypothetical protein
VAKDSRAHTGKLDVAILQPLLDRIGICILR